MPVLVALGVIDIVLLVDALHRFGVADALELGLCRDILLQIASRAAALRRSRLDAVDDVAVVIVTRGLGAAVVHVALLRRIERTTRDAVPATAGTIPLAIRLSASCCKDL